MPPRFKALPELADISPAEMAARGHGLPGFVFFDSSKEAEAGGSLSILAAFPEERIEGNLFLDTDYQRLHSRVLELQSSGGAVDDGLPGSLIAGTVDYDGAFQMAFYPGVLVYRHAEGGWVGIGDLDECFRNRVPDARLHGPICFEPDWSEKQFCGAVARAQEYIAAGDIYQVNLSHRLEAPWPGGDPWAFYEALRHYSPAPYSAFLNQGQRVVLSSSPELFLRVSGSSIRTRPIKGTRPRRSDPNADERSAFDLLTSSKEISELVMITDLERSDLGQVCEWGSVAVRDLLKLERHEQVFHLVSTVEGRMRPGVNAVEALRACFPGGSITGAPKRRAREIIRELEEGDRGIYTGALGWFGASGESALSIAIRTVVVENDQACLRVGAGVVSDSVPELEWQETWDKAAGVLLAAQWVGGTLDRTLPEIQSGATSKATGL